MVGGNGADPSELKFSWSIANPTLREWAGENREAWDRSPESARRRIGRVSRWDDADSRVADWDAFSFGGRVTIRFKLGGSPESRGCGSGDALIDRRARAAIRSRDPRSSRLAILPGFPAYHLGVPLTRPQGTDHPESEPDHEGREPSSFLTP